MAEQLHGGCRMRNLGKISGIGCWRKVATTWVSLTWVRFCRPLSRERRVTRTESTANAKNGALNGLGGLTKPNVLSNLQMSQDADVSATMNDGNLRTQGLLEFLFSYDTDEQALIPRTRRVRGRAGVGEATGSYVYVMDWGRRRKLRKLRMWLRPTPDATGQKWLRVFRTREWPESPKKGAKAW